MKITIGVEPKFWLQMDAVTLSALLECAHAHYDSTCKESARVGGFLYGWRNMVDADYENVHASWCELDISLKICEMVHYHSAQTAIILGKYTLDVRKAMNRSRELSSVEINLP